MKERKGLRKVMVAALAAAMMLMLSIPVYAAKGVTQVKGGVVVSKGTNVHLLNKNISGNGINSYTYRITPLSSGTKYDIVYAYGGTVKALRGATTDSGNITNSTYFKSSSKSNTGLIACLQVRSGSVKIQAKVKASKTSAKLGVQVVSHSPLKSSKIIKSGRYIYMTGSGGNINTFPLIMSGKSGTRVKRILNSKTKSFEYYDFKSSYVLFRSYKNNKLVKSMKRSYVSKEGSTRYYFMLVPENSKGNAYTGKMYIQKGSAKFYYPADYLKVNGASGKY